MRTPEERIRITNQLATNLEDHILEGVANKKYAPDYVLEKNLDDGEVNAWVHRIAPLKSIRGTVILKKPIP